MENLTEEEAIQKYMKSDAIGYWHSPKRVKIGTSTPLHVAGLMTGCGLAQMSGVCYINNNLGEEITKKKLNKELKTIKNDGVGAVICTLGQVHYNREKILFDLGFEMLKEYPNYRHCAKGNYKQRLYILTL